MHLPIYVYYGKGKPSLSKKYRKVEAHFTCACKVLSQCNAARCLDGLAAEFRMMAITLLSSALVAAIIRT